MKKRLSKPAIKHLGIYNLAVGILKVRSTDEVKRVAISLTKNSKALNQHRKLLKKLDEEIEQICNYSKEIFSTVITEDVLRIRRAVTPKTIALIPEDATNPELLALNLLYLNFNENIDKKMDERLKSITKHDYMDMIIAYSEVIGLEKDIADEMYLLAEILLEDIRK